MADENVRNLRDGVIVIEDGSTPANSLMIVCEEGNLNWNETSDIKQIKDRNRISHMRLGEEEPVAFSFSVHYKYSVASAAEPLSPYEVFHHQDGAAAWVTTNICGDVHTVDIKFTMPDPCAAGESETIIFRRVPLPNVSFEEGDESNEISFEGIAYVTAPRIYRGTTTTTTSTTSTSTTTTTTTTTTVP